MNLDTGSARLRFILKIDFKDRTIQKLTNILIVLISHITLLAGDDNLLWRSFVIEKK